MVKGIRNQMRPRSPRSLGGLVLSCSAVLIGFAVGPAACYGSAFSVAELGARASGMGTAFTGLADDGSALFYNVAGIAFQPGAHLQMDNAVVVGLFRFTPSAPPTGQVIPEKGFSQSI